MGAESIRLAGKKRQQRAFVRARLVLVLLFAALWLTLAPIGYAMPYGFLMVLVVEAATLWMYLRLVDRVPNERALDRFHFVLLAMELAFHTAIVYYLGGLSWLGVVAYIYGLLYAAVFLNVRQAVVFTAAVAAAFMIIVSLDGAGVIAHQWYLPQGPDRFRDPQFLVTTTVAFVGVLATVTFWMVFVGNELRRERDVALRANAELLRAQDELRLLNEELERKVDERTKALQRRAERDQLTGLLNRWAVTRRCQEMLSLARRGGRSLAVVMADADGFKACNDRGGHPYGDEVLQGLARSLRGSCRASDTVGRMGGDEFLVILPDTTVRGALRLCQRVAKRIGEWQSEQSHGLPVPSLSFGVATYPEHGSTLEEIVGTADRALYEAKAEGGGCWKVGRRRAEEEAPAPVQDGSPVA